MTPWPLAGGRSGRERLLELLGEQALGPLGRRQELELEVLLRLHPDVDAHTFERVTAALELGLLARAPRSWPAAVRRGVEADAAANLFARGPASGAKGRGHGRGLREGSHGALWLALAAGAMLALALVVFWRHYEEPARPDAALAEGRWMGELVAPGGGPALGTLHWDALRGSGTLHFEGLAPNDPGRQRYQLWLQDGERGHAPVSAALFDTPADGRPFSVALRPHLPVGRLTGALLTLEAPRGALAIEGELVGAWASESLSLAPRTESPTRPSASPTR